MSSTTKWTLWRNMPAIVAINLFQCALVLSINMWPCLLPLVEVKGHSRDAWPFALLLGLLVTDRCNFSQCVRVASAKYLTLSLSQQVLPRRLCGHLHHLNNSSRNLKDSTTLTDVCTLGSSEHRILSGCRWFDSGSDKRMFMA